MSISVSPKVNIGLSVRLRVLGFISKNPGVNAATIHRGIKAGTQPGISLALAGLRNDKMVRHQRGTRNYELTSRGIKTLVKVHSLLGA